MIVLPRLFGVGTLGVGSGLAVLQFGETISVTAIIVAALVVVLGGIFTLRNNMRSFWRDLAEERKAQNEQLEEEVREKQNELLDLERRHNAEMLAFSEEQREIRHGLKTRLAEMGHQLDLERAKHDMSGVTERLGHLETLAISRGEMFDRLDKNVATNAALLERLLSHPTLEEK